MLKLTIYIASSLDFIIDTVKPIYVVTSIKQSPMFKGHLLSSCHGNFQMNLFLRGRLSNKATFSLSLRLPLNTGFIVFIYAYLTWF